MDQGTRFSAKGLKIFPHELWALITNQKFRPTIMFGPFIDKHLANLESCLAALDNANHLAVGAPTKTIEKCVLSSQKWIKETIYAYNFVETNLSGNCSWPRWSRFGTCCTCRTFEVVLSPLNYGCFASGMPEDPS